MVAQQGAVYRQGAAVVERTEQLVTRAKLRELALQGEEQRKFIDRYKAAHQQATTAFEAEVGKRAALSEREKQQVESVALAIVHSHEVAERRATAEAERGRRERKRIADQEAREQEQAQERAAREAEQRRNRDGARGREVGRQVGQTAVTATQEAYRRNQDAREVFADRERRINDFLIETGGTAAERGGPHGTNQFIQDEIYRRGLNPDAAIEALATSQHFASALQGRDQTERMGAIRATLNDAQFASVINPTDIAGTTRLGAVLRRRVGDETLRQSILRGAVGISFGGSTETADAVTRGLPGLLQAISVATANAPAADRDRITSDVARDFLAQLQAQTASGRTVTVAANRANTVRNALALPVRQDRLGHALAQRMSTPEEWAHFATAFTKNERGQYVMAPAVRDNASHAARFLGQVFGNDQEALTAFMATRGGAEVAGQGRAQLMERADVAALGSYFNTIENDAGQTVRQYDYVDELSRMTVLPGQEGEMRATRQQEDALRLQQEHEAALRDARNRDGRGGFWGTLANRGSDWWRSFSAANPFTASGVAGGSTLGAVGLSGLAGKTLAMTLGGGPAALMAALAGAGTALGAYGSSATAATGLDAAGNRVSTGERVTRGAAAAASPFFFAFGPVISAIKDLPREFAQALRDNPPVVGPSGTSTGDVHGQTTGAGDGGR